MNCEKYLNLIDDLIEGELSVEQGAGQVNSHLQICPECAAYYKTLEQEKEIYAHYLFDVEPPTDMWTKFQAKAKPEAEAVSLQIPETANASSGWKTNIARFFRLYPALGFALVLVAAFGIALWKFAPGENPNGDEYIAEKESNNVREIAPQSGEIKENETENLLTKDDIDKFVASPKFVKSGDQKNKFLNGKPNGKTINKLVAVKTPKANEKTISAVAVAVDKRQKAPGIAQPSEEQLRQLQLSNLEKATTEQFEKIELLLRSFRNARRVEGADFYDVGYEKQQARKLLERNVWLRQMAGSYGTLYTEEILDKVEPFLLDIANLENNPLPEKIQDIKERVRNQNIIASLQIY